jgi:hypothetical protein
MVGRRLVPLVVAIAVAFVPCALEACETDCLAQVARASSAAHHHDASFTEGTSQPSRTSDHVHHHHSPPSQRLTVARAVSAGDRHVCAHGDDPPASSPAGHHMLTAPDVAVVTLDVVALCRPALATSNPALPAQIALTTQLRL